MAKQRHTVTCQGHSEWYWGLGSCPPGHTVRVNASWSQPVSAHWLLLHPWCFAFAWLRWDLTLTFVLPSLGSEMRSYPQRETCFQSLKFMYDRQSWTMKHKNWLLPNTCSLPTPALARALQLWLTIRWPRACPLTSVFRAVGVVTMPASAGGLKWAKDYDLSFFF